MGVSVQEAEGHEYWHSSSMVYSGSQQYCNARQGCGREISTVETLDIGRIVHIEVPLGASPSITTTRREDTAPDSSESTVVDTCHPGSLLMDTLHRLAPCTDSGDVKAVRQLRSHMETARTVTTKTRKGSTDVPTSIRLQRHQRPWPVTDEKALFSASNPPSLLTTSRTP